MLIPGADPVRKVTIIPRGGSLGVTLSSPDTDRFNYTDHELHARSASCSRVGLPSRWSSAS